MGERRRKHRRKLAGLFLSVLTGVLCIGILGMALLHYIMPEEERQVYEIFHLPSSPLEIFTSNTQKDEIADADQTLLQDALSRNQKAYLANCEQ